LKTTDKQKTNSSEFVLTTEWILYLLFLSVLALLYIYLTHRTDNIVRDIEKAKKNLVELRAEDITLKSEIIQNRSRENLEKRLEGTGVKEPNRAIQRIKDNGEH
jgi:cell division protein FtsB